MFRVSGTVRKGSKTVIYRHHFLFRCSLFHHKKTRPKALCKFAILSSKGTYKAGKHHQPRDWKYHTTVMRYGYGKQGQNDQQMRIFGELLTDRVTYTMCCKTSGHVTHFQEFSCCFCALLTVNYYFSLWQSLAMGMNFFC